MVELEVEALPRGGGRISRCPMADLWRWLGGRWWTLLWENMDTPPPQNVKSR